MDAADAVAARPHLFHLRHVAILEDEIKGVIGKQDGGGVSGRHD
jgi:hypothetical protein